MKIESFEIVDRCLFWKSEKILVVGDLHLGYEGALKESGVSLPLEQTKQTKELFEKIFRKTGKVSKIILLGDVKHYFGKVLKQERDDFVNLIYFFRKYLLKNGKIIITKGNHDSILEPIVKNYPEVELVNYLIEKDVLFFHGDLKSLTSVNFHLFDRKVNLVVKGHFHPAIVLTDGSKKEKYKCFVYGEFIRKKTIILPSFFPLIEGKNILDEDSYIYGKEVLRSNIYVIGDFDKIYKMNVKDLLKD